MNNLKRNIFRRNAVKHYIRGREEEVLPRLVSPKVFLFLWVLLGLLVGAGFITWLAEVPTHTSGTAVVLDNDNTTLVFLPANQLNRLKVGQNVQFKLDKNNTAFASKIIEIEPNIVAPEDARKRFNLEGELALVIKEPSAIVKVDTKMAFADKDYAGSILSSNVEIGSRRIISFMPLIGNLLAGDQK